MNRYVVTILVDAPTEDDLVQAMTYKDQPALSDIRDYFNSAGRGITFVSASVEEQE